MFYRILDFFKYLPKEIKWFFQRGFKGYCDRDVWNIDSWFERNIIPMLKELKETKHSYPMDMTEKQWEIELDNMIHCFEEMTDDCSEKNEYWEEYKKHLFSIKKKEDLDKELQEKWLKREEEIEDYQVSMKNKALKMFSKHYYNLWD